MNIVILAAGQGKRMHSDLPKVLHPIGGRPMLAHVIATARALKPKKICIVYGHGGEAVKNAIPDADLAWALQEPQLGTGHALQQALPHLDSNEPTLVLYGDVPLTKTSTLKHLIEAANTGTAVLTVDLVDPHGYGRILRDDNYLLTGIVEEKDATLDQRGISEVNTGILVLPTAKLAGWLKKLTNKNAQGEYYLTDVIGLAAAEGAVASAQPAAEWEILGVNSKAQLAELERCYQYETAMALMNGGVTLADPARIDVRGHLACGRDVTIDVNCIFEGDVLLGDNVKIGANCVLKNVKIASGTIVAPFCHFEEAEIGAEGRIGPFARLRPGTVLAEDVHIGNFVEVKNSQVAAHSKANHLSYIGDATVGSRVNIGAGTITCNYDGANKHRTVIEDDVFIGSDTQLVAPVTVGRGATLGAGTTLTKDAPPGALTVGRAKQVTVANWKRPLKKSK